MDGSGGGAGGSRGSGHDGSGDHHAADDRAFELREFPRLPSAAGAAARGGGRGGGGAGRAGLHLRAGGVGASLSGSGGGGEGGEVVRISSSYGAIPTRPPPPSMLGQHSMLHRDMVTISDVEQEDDEAAHDDGYPEPHRTAMAAASPASAPGGRSKQRSPGTGGGSRHTHFAPHRHYRRRREDGVEIEESESEEEEEEDTYEMYEGTPSDGASTPTTQQHPPAATRSHHLGRLHGLIKSRLVGREGDVQRHEPAAAGGDGEGGAVRKRSRGGGGGGGHLQARGDEEDNSTTEKEEEEERAESEDDGRGRNHHQADRLDRASTAAHRIHTDNVVFERHQQEHDERLEGLHNRKRNKLRPFRKASLPATMFGSRWRDYESHHRPLLDPERATNEWTAYPDGYSDSPGLRYSPNTRTAQSMKPVDVADGYYEFELKRQQAMGSRFTSRTEDTRSSRRPSLNPRLHTLPLDLGKTSEFHTANRIPQPRKYKDINPDAPDELPPTKPAPLKLLKPKRKRQVSWIYKAFDWLWKVLTWRFPRAMWPLAPAILMFMIAGILAGFFYVYYDVEWEGTRSWRWMVWAGSVIAVFVVSNYLFAMLMWLLKRILFETKVFYYINTVSTTLSFFASSIVLLALSGTILKGWDSTPRWWIQKTLTSMLVISILHFLVILGTKYLIVKLHREHFWESISKYLISERIIWKMAYGIRRKEAVKRSHFLRKPSMHQFQHAWQWMLDKRANPYLEVTSYEMDAERAEVPLEHSASVARVILKNLDTYNKGYLEEEDFDRFFEYEDDVQAALALFPRGQTIDLALITEVVHRVHKDRKVLYKTLFDRENAGKVLTYIITTFFAIAMVFVVMLIFELSITQYLIPLGTFFLGFSFIFGSSLKNLWEGVVLIFAVRPFDIGDRITIPGTVYPTLIVSKISLFTTTFYSTDGRCFIIPNQQLYMLPITQYKRSKNYAVQVSVHLDFRTPTEKILMLRQKVYEWMKQDSAPWLIRTDEDWMCWVDLIENANKITVVFWIELQDINWQRPRFYLVPKSNLYLAIQRACEELNIGYHLPDQPVLVKKMIDVLSDGREVSSRTAEDLKRDHEKLAKLVGD